jgi:4-nitrophenyl phosphatase
MYKSKFDQLGVETHVVRRHSKFVNNSKDCWRKQDEIYGSAYASAVYLSSIAKLQKSKKVYVVGMSGLEEELREEGISFIGGTVGNFVLTLSPSDKEN